MKVQVTIDLAEFGDEFQSLSEWARNEVKDEIKNSLKSDPRWKEFIKEQTDKVIDLSMKGE